MRGRSISQKVAVSAVFVAAMFMNIMDATIVNVAVPTIGRQFHVGAASVDGVAIGYLVSLAVFIPASGWLGDRLGGKRVLLTAIVVFTVASALCGQASSFGELVAFRVLQGVGGGMMAPVGMAMLFRTFPPAERVRASSILTVPTTLAPALGPVLGGLLVTDLSWRWVFYVNVPIGLAAVGFGLLFLDEQKQAAPGRFDAVGFALAGIGLGLLMYGVSEGPAKGWGTPRIVGSAASGAVLLVALVGWELRAAQPLIDVRLLTDRLYRSATGVMVLASTSFIGVLYIVALFFQYGRGLSALASGLSTFPEALGVMLGAQLASRALYPRFGPRRVLTGGLVAVAVSVALMALIGSTTSLWWIRLLLFVMGLGMANVFVPAQAASFATISRAATGRASTLFNAGRQVGSAVGVAVLTTVLAAVGPVRRTAAGEAPDLAAYHWAFLAAAAIALAAVVLAVRIHDRDADSTRPARFTGVPRTAAGPALQRTAG